MIADFINRYFWQPYITNSGYNYINTLTYGILLVIALFLINNFSEKFKIRMTKRKFLSLLPFVFLGSTIRVLEDAHILPETFFLVTPGIYLIMLFVTILALFISERTKNPDKNLLIFGSILWFVALSFLRIENFIAIPIILLVFLIAVSLLFIARKFFNILRDNIDFACLSAHFFDASATFVTLDFFSYLGYWEQHPLTRTIGILGGSYIWFFVAKLYVLIVLYFINKDVESENFRMILKFAVLTLGLAPGIRDALRLIMRV